MCPKGYTFCGVCFDLFRGTHLRLTCASLPKPMLDYMEAQGPVPRPSEGAVVHIMKRGFHSQEVEVY